MNKKLQDIFTYHEETKHNYGRYAKSLGYMDWENQPSPYRSYKGALKIKLPLSFENSTPAYHLIFTRKIPSAPLIINSISQFLQFSMGLSAIKSDGHNQWALRCNASSGNLQPSEAYIILPPLDDVEKKTSISHYAPQNHELEIISTCNSDIWKNLPTGSFFVALSSIVYREVWKYGERAFRYTQLDAGHALRALQISAKTLGWHYKIVNYLEDKELAKLLGLDQKNRFNERENESPDILMLITPNRFDKEIQISQLTQNLPLVFNSVANSIAQTYQHWKLIDTIEYATFDKNNTEEIINDIEMTREPTREAKQVILTRRSAQIMNKTNSKIPLKEFETILKSTIGNFGNSVNLILFMHNVENLKAGLYIYIRNNKYKNELVALMNNSFSWDKTGDDLYILQSGDFREKAKNISCNQDIASDSAFSLGMLCPFSNEIIKYGSHRYKELYWECGAIGQQLYLEATSLGLSATGIGCYLDDVFHQLLGLESNQFQSLYHFTIGRGLIDARLLTKKPYEHRL